MKRIIVALAVSLFGTKLWAGSANILPDFGLNDPRISTSTIELIPIYLGNATNMMMGVVVKSTEAWKLNMKIDPFILKGTTYTLELGQVSYHVATQAMCDTNPTYYASTNTVTVYTAAANEYVTNGTTLAVTIGVHPWKKSYYSNGRPGYYSSRVSFTVEKP